MLPSSSNHCVSTNKQQKCGPCNVSIHCKIIFIKKSHVVHWKRFKGHVGTAALKHPSLTAFQIGVIFSISNPWHVTKKKIMVGKVLRISWFYDISSPPVEAVDFMKHGRGKTGSNSWAKKKSWEERRKSGQGIWKEPFWWCLLLSRR